MNKLFQFGVAFLLALTLLLPATSGYAATNTIQITPTSTDWSFVDDNKVTGWTTGFESGPGTAPLGTGSVYIELSSTGAGIVFGTQKYQGTLLSSITDLSYSTYTNLSPVAMAFQINYDPDVTTIESSTWYGRLIYEPYFNGTVTNETWQTWDMINGGNGKWWASGSGNSVVDEACPQSAPCTWTALITAFPNIGIRNDALSFIQFKAGSTWNGFAGNADNLSIGIGGNTDIYDFEPLTDVYVDDSWSAVPSGTDPDSTGPALLYGTDSFDTVQEGINAVSANGTVHVADGVYTEDLTINKSLDLLGPNAIVNPNSGTRAAEAIVHPATSNPDPVAVCSVVTTLNTGGITIKGFTFDGDNPSITSGVMIGTADVDACEILAGYEGMGNITVENNILKNSTYSGIDFYNDTNPSATSGNYIRHNLIENVGTVTYGYGIGVLVYNNFYADITNNVLNNVRVGIQTGNYSQANPGVTGSISNNVIHSWRLGIFHNLWYSNASNVPVTNNLIDVIDKAGTPRWAGIALTSFSVPATLGPNTINATNVTQQTVGYMIWSDYLASGLSVAGGTVTGADYGVWVNNYAGYTSNANNTSISVENVTISEASLAGIYVQDDPLNTNNATVQATITNSPISNSAVGILIQGSDASATGSCNQITGNTAGVNNTTATLLNFEKNWWGVATGPSGSGSGTGDSVSANVDFSPWNADAACTVFTTNLAPVITEGTSINVTMSEDGSPAPFSLTLNASDPDAGDTLTWSVSTPAANGTASASGTGLSKAINYTPALNFSGPDSFVVQVSDGLASDVITVNVIISAVSTAPTDIALSSTSINENQPASTVVGTLSTTDPDIGDSFTYSFCGGAGDSSFTINGATLKTAATFDYETRNSYIVCIQSTDSHALNMSKSFTISINNLTDTATFEDVPPNHWAWAHVEAIYAAGITSGCGTRLYCPTTPVTRDQMAVFLLRGIHGSTYNPPPMTGTVFADVPMGYWAGAWIEQLAAEGITAGCSSDNYCPTTPVTRDQMAVFLLRAKYGVSYNPPAANGALFSDVPIGHWAGAWVEQLAAEGITAGCSSNNYCPTTPVTRDQMAVFLQRTFNLPLP
jgi:hypothetical protein